MADIMIYDMTDVVHISPLFVKYNVSHVECPIIYQVNE